MRPPPHVREAVEFVAHRAPPDRQEIQSYGPGAFTISGVRHEGSLIVTASAVLPLSAERIGELAVADLEPLLAGGTGIDLLLLGTGSTFALPPSGLLRELRGRGLAVEFMTTAAACRTFNLLASEERRVAAVLIAISG